jgi:hypothetical protein
MFIATLPAICIILGLLMYALCINPKLSEVGRLTFFAGLLAYLCAFAPTALKLLH